MALKDKILEQINAEIDKTLELGREKRDVNIETAKQVAEMLAELSASDSYKNKDAQSLSDDYIANIKNICNSNF